MGESAAVLARHGLASPTIRLGLEPPITQGGPRHRRQERRSISGRWLSGTVLTGLAGAGLIGVAIYGTLDRHRIVAQAPEIVVAAPRDSEESVSDVVRGDRLVKTVDIVAEKQSFRVPVAVNVGDKQVMRLRGYTHLSTTLTTTPTDLADQVPRFNPLKLLAADQPNVPDQATDPGPTLDAAEVAFEMRDLASADPQWFAGELSVQDVQAQVAQAAKGATQAGDHAELPLPPQLFFLRTSRLGIGLSNPALPLGYVNPAAAIASPFSSIEVKMVPENVSVVPRSEGRDKDQPEEKLVVVRHADSLEEILKANGATRDQIRSIVQAFGARRGEPPVAEGRRIRLLIADLKGDGARQIARISIYRDEDLETTVAADDDGQYVQVQPVDPEAARKAAEAAQDAAEEGHGGLRLYDSVYQTALKQQIPVPIIDQMIRIFSNDIDFQQSVQGGDTIEALYANASEGETTDSLLFASLTVGNEVYRYYRYQSPDEQSPQYFDDNGRSMRKFLIRNPVPNAVFTSPFGMRFHPILGYSRPHTGVDWAAPVGTPILAAGNGTILKAEHSPSYGNHIEIQHANDYITTYSHMVGFARGMHEGLKVRQGQVIGYLGQTGLATGPHLHYEVIVNGHFVDPMRVKLSQTRELSGQQLADFKREHDRINGLMASAPNGGGDSLQKHAAN